MYVPQCITGTYNTFTLKKKLYFFKIIANFAEDENIGFSFSRHKSTVTIS